MSVRWQTGRLADLTTKIGSGATPRGGRESYPESGIPFIRSLNVYDSRFTDKNLAFLTDAQARALNNVVVEKNDVLFNITGASIARCCRAPVQYLPARVNQHVAIIRPIADMLDADFLVYLLISKEYKDNLLGIGEKAGATRQAITKAQLESLDISYPSLDEQKRIVVILDEAFEGLDRAAANAKKNLANARELFDSSLDGIFKSETLTGATVVLADLATDITDGDHLPPPKAPEGIPFITISNINKETNRIDFTDTFKVPQTYFDALKPNRKPKRGDVLYSVTGSFGIPVLVEDDVEFCFQRHIGLVRPKPGIKSKWLYYLLMSKLVKKQAQATATGTAQKTVSLSALRRFAVPTMSSAEQEAIIAVLDELAERTQMLRSVYLSKIAALSELRQSILQKAFAGELQDRLEIAA